MEIKKYLTSREGGVRSVIYPALHHGTSWGICGLCKASSRGDRPPFGWHRSPQQVEYFLIGTHKQKRQQKSRRLGYRQLLQ